MLLYIIRQTTSDSRARQSCTFRLAHACRTRARSRTVPLSETLMLGGFICMSCKEYCVRGTTRQSRRMLTDCACRAKLTTGPAPKTKNK